ILDVIPRAPAVPGEVQATVGAEDHLIRKLWIDPQRVVVAVHALTLREALPCLAAVPRFARLRVERDDMLRIGGIAANLAVIPRGAVRVVDLPPVRARVVGAVDAVGV